jgi:methionyl aminopeptidase
MITLKKPAEVERMRKAGRVVADVLMMMREIVKPGVDTMALDEAACDVIERASAKAAFKGYRAAGISIPFPGAICVSINDEIVHGIPSRDRVLDEGDIISVDVGAVIDGYYGDAACTYPVGAINTKRAELLDVTHRALHIGIDQILPGRTIGDIGCAIEKWTLSKGCGLVREWAGHGIGRKLHEAPQIPNHGKAGSGVTLKSGLTFCVEPMIMNGREEVKSLKNGWTVVTCDGSDAAHFEHTILVTENGPEILTPWE